MLELRGVSFLTIHESVARLSMHLADVHSRASVKYCVLTNQADHEASVVSLGIMNAGSISLTPCSSYLNVLSHSI